jgi:hypothetical protein
MVAPDPAVEAHAPSPHPLVALPRARDRRAPRLPGATGERRPTGALPRRTVDALMAMLEALVSDDGVAPPAERLDWTREELEDFFSRADARGRLMFRLGALVVSTAAPLMIGARPPLARLPLSRRVEALQRLEASPLASVFMGLRAVLCLIYYEHPDAAAEIGVPLAPRSEG